MSGPVPTPVNEPVLSYAPGTPERTELEAELAAQLQAGPIELPATIGGRQCLPGGAKFAVQMPSDHRTVLGHSAHSTADDANAAITAARDAAGDWARASFGDRAAIFLRAAQLLAGPWRAKLNAATMLGQAKTVQQAEIDSACELIDFWRFNVAFAEQLSQVQPVSTSAVWNQSDYRPLEGFVYAVTPFNFTAIAGNLPTAPALMGNVVLWKPSPTQMVAAHHTMRLLEAAGLPPGVINLLPGDGVDVSARALTDPALAGLHFTGSTATFNKLWSTIGAAIGSYRSYPRIVGETGGKDFVIAHPSADPQVVISALVRGAYEYSGQKCSAASRAYLSQTTWDQVKDDLIEKINSLPVGDPRDFRNFTSAVIDERSYTTQTEAIAGARSRGVQVLAGGTHDSSTGWFVRPTLLRADLRDEIFSREYFGPILAVHVFPDAEFDAVCGQVAETSSYALTGAIIATDQAAITSAAQTLRQAAGNFYINDKPTGAVVGQQPFGGARNSGTNDKAGSIWNLIRWASPRSIKEALIPPSEIAYPHMGQ